jgi:hypothetical protein
MASLRFVRGDRNGDGENIVPEIDILSRNSVAIIHRAVHTRSPYSLYIVGFELLYKLQIYLVESGGAVMLESRALYTGVFTSTLGVLNLWAHSDLPPDHMMT